ncbi:YwpF-like family protein [Bacillus atrophaeus]|uniref:YwpF-like family protein n=1 Tax=Bacillus atrophaeus TaxID=1452 RepID=UPI0022802289|nr:YwpF-like family protein [Bacillus atrophaeus]MCY8521160.1 YwpF-like family protein [Bacillus atrophaeus]MCY8523969.1 YwpF-like family protein [Bacillus atrophaeus]MDL5143221.1 YwpF-like family protein [Bacillus atrophaeus]MDS9995859.1 YwpF-like family protein [Bacillus atrophaeus]MEC0697213.1 YwpF-like family protein [Bacillus atrophaeus]
MKTFKLVDLNVERLDKEGQPFEQFPLIDGLIINKEDGENHWMIEALVSKEHKSFFQKLQENQTEVKVFVTITKKSNRPAQLSASIKNIVELEESISVLIYGQMVTRKQQGSDTILENLVKEGYTGSKLLEAFKQKM